MCMHRDTSGRVPARGERQLQLAGMYALKAMNSSFQLKGRLDKKKALAKESEKRDITR